MSISNFWSAYFDSISDYESRFKFNEEIDTNLFEEEFFNTYKDKEYFEAIVYDTDIDKASDGKYYIFYRIRPIEIHGFILPDPCEMNRSPYYGGIQGFFDTHDSLIALHPLAIGAGPFSKYPNSSLALGQGDVVRVTYMNGGPQFKGHLRGLTLVENKAVYNARGGLYKCAQASVKIEIPASGVGSTTPKGENVVNLKPINRDSPSVALKKQSKTTLFKTNRIKPKRIEPTPPGTIETPAMEHISERHTQGLDHPPTKARRRITEPSELRPGDVFAMDGVCWKVTMKHNSNHDPYSQLADRFRFTYKKVSQDDPDYRYCPIVDEMPYDFAFRGRGNPGNYDKVEHNRETYIFSTEDQAWFPEKFGTYQRYQACVVDKHLPKVGYLERSICTLDSSGRPKIKSGFKYGGTGTPEKE